ncbi:cytochrome c1 [Martelella lutilitoris]|uniref:Cytochrome c1 n=1 Tax=Martelella lutilitoris TaxID=2583532 RepID=A0A5C4JVS3_9HYPH|nr:cytochrome c1 [Martelella lutilitoris]TNB49330.1 cytochrome c1 [Martelella lutilitoris]
MKKLIATVLFSALLSPFCLSAAVAAEEGEGGGTPHYPLEHPEEMDWSFAGPLGTYDRGQLQRGLKVYKQVCSACHSLDLVAFRTLSDLGYSEEQVKAFAAEYEIEAGPDNDGNMYMRPGIPSDYFPAPFENPEQAAASNNGAAPPDLSLMAKARGITRGFPTFVFDIFTQYQEGGPDYIHALLTGYEEPPEGVEIPAGTYYNPYFANAASLAMAPPLSDGIVSYDDGAPETVDQYSRDIAAFLMWTAEPKLEDRKQTGLVVMVFLVILAVLVFLTKKSVYARKHD